jgi:hypothetical protein
VPGQHPVKGKVVVKGVPAGGVFVVFHQRGSAGGDAARPSGITDENGVYTLTTTAGLGAPPGEYDVTLVWEREPTGTVTGGDNAKKDAFNGRYRTPGSSGFKASVAAGPNEITPFTIN